MHRYKKALVKLDTKPIFFRESDLHDNKLILKKFKNQILNFYFFIFFLKIFLFTTVDKFSLVYGMLTSDWLDRTNSRHSGFQFLHIPFLEQRKGTTENRIFVIHKRS